MKITAPAAAAAFVKKPDAAARIILMYGPDSGLARERLDALARGFAPDLDDPFRVTRLAGPSLTEDPQRLLDEAASPAFGGDRRLVLVTRTPDSVAPIVATLLERPAQLESCVILLEAGDLDKRSKLRAVVDEAGPVAVALPCYVEEGADMARTVATILAEENLAAPKEVVTTLAALLPPDRQAMRSELTKLALYVHGTGRVTLDDVHAVLDDATGAALDALLDAAMLGDVGRACATLERLLAEDTAPVALIRATQNHLVRLHAARGAKDAGARAEDAVKRLQPPVFWKRVPAVTRQVERWSLPALESVLTEALSVEVALKRTGSPDTLLISHFLMALAARKK